jgi:hypothetical protein
MGGFVRVHECVCVCVCARAPAVGRPCASLSMYVYVYMHAPLLAYLCARVQAWMHVPCPYVRRCPCICVGQGGRVCLTLKILWASAGGGAGHHCAAAVVDH